MEITKKISTLKEFLWIHRINQGDFAKRCGLSLSQISRLCRGDVNPKYETALIVEKETGGKIKAETIMRFCFETQLEEAIRKYKKENGDK